MRKSRLSWHKQERLIEHFVSGSTARCTACLVDVNKSTAAYYFQRLRELIALHMSQEAHKSLVVRLKWMSRILAARAKAREAEVQEAKCLYLVC
jgi:transposase